MASIPQGVRSLPVAQNAEDLAEAINREIVPVLRALRDEIHRLSGDQLTADEDTTLEPLVSVCICTNTSAITVTLPDASDFPERRVVVIRTDAAVTLASSGGDIQGSATQAVTTVASVVSDGTDWWFTTNV